MALQSTRLLPANVARRRARKVWPCECYVLRSGEKE
jgi:hypothetical protein